MLDSAQQKSEKYCLAQRSPKQSECGRRQRDRRCHLETAAHKNQPFHFGQPLYGKLEADREQQQHHADLGEDLDRGNFADKAKAVGTDRDPRKHQANKQRQLQTQTHKGDRHGYQEDDQKVTEELRRVHLKLELL